MKGMIILTCGHWNILCECGTFNMETLEYYAGRAY